MNIENTYLKTLKQLVQKTEQSIMREDRTGTGTYSLFGVQMKHDMTLGFPMLTTKRMAVKSVFTELMWLMKGQTTLRPLLEVNNTFWVGDCYKKYANDCSVNNSLMNEWLRKNEDGSLSIYTRAEFIDKILKDDRFSNRWGDMGPIYGKQWRSIKSDFGQIDQLQEMVDKLRNTPNDRRMLVDSWNVSELKGMLLPPCHLLYQCFVEKMSKQEMKKYPGFEKKISLQWYQRSADTVLGVPANIASYATLLTILGKMTGYMPFELTGAFGDIHIYSDHIEAAKIQIARQPLPLPNIQFDENIKFDGTVDEMLASITDVKYQISLNDYMPHSVIKANLSN